MQLYAKVRCRGLEADVFQLRNGRLHREGNPLGIGAFYATVFLFTLQFVFT